MTDATFTPPPQPDPVVTAEWASFGRHALTLAGGALAAFGLSLPSWLSSITDPQLNIIISAVMFFGGSGLALVGYLKGRWNAWHARQVVVASAKASAEHGVPVSVTITPEGMPNVATHISATEQAAAPSVPQGVPPQPAPVGP